MLFWFVQIELLVGDSKLEKYIAVSEAHRLVQRGSVAVIGPAASGPTMEVSKSFRISSTDRTLIGYAATSSELSKLSYSNFVRTPPSDDVPAKLMAKLMKGPLVDHICFRVAVECVLTLGVRNHV